MRSSLAEKLLAKIMEWSPEEIDRERPLLQALADFKFNEYQQFAPGTRFIESLVKWLQQFDTLLDKQLAYRMVMEHLIFISTEQMAHLVSILFSEKINPILIRKTGEEIGLEAHFVRKIVNSKRYRENIRMSLFVGLSDGARIDQFRRAAGLNNEQVLTTYSISSEKIGDMLQNLQEEVPEAKFKSIFLLDDFTASGKSYCRPEENKGKLLKFFEAVFSHDEEGYSTMIDYDNLEIHVFFYIATLDALNNITEGIRLWQQKVQKSFPFTVDCLLPIDENVKERLIHDPKIMQLLQTYFDPAIMTKHYKKGKHDEPYLGFNECALPLILSHNTPNNSLPILWTEEDRKFRGLFPRISRHK